MAHLLIRQSFTKTVSNTRGSRRTGPRPHHMDLEYLPKNYLWETPPTPLVFDPVTKWTQQSVRCGVLGVKQRMTHVWDEWLNFIALTVIKVPNCQVIQHKTVEKDGYSAIQVGAGERKAKNISKPVLGHLAKAGIPPKRKICEFKITPDAYIPVGTEINVTHFTPGQQLDFIGLTKGKGFQGVMKRWGFSGGRASHGASLSHRSLGSTGQRQDPGKVFKNKKMPGRMGADRRTLKNVTNLLYVRGGVIGPDGGWLQIKDAKNKKHKTIPPFPTSSPITAETPIEITQSNPKPDWWIDEDVNFDERRIVRIEGAKEKDEKKLETRVADKQKRDAAKEKVKKVKKDEKKKKAKEVYQQEYQKHLERLEKNAREKEEKKQRGELEEEEEEEETDK